MSTSKRPIAILLSVLVALAGFAALTPGQPAVATPAPSIDKVTDPPTMHEFPGKTADHYMSSRFPGRIWVDKTILDQEGLDEATSLLPVKPKPITLKDDELAVVLSARGSTRHVSGQFQVPIDLVIVLDNSRSMAQCVTSDSYCDGPTTYKNSRAYAMTEAVNDAIGIIMENNAANRVAITQFGTGAGTLYTLSTPRLVTGTSSYVTLSAPTTSGGTMTFRTATNSMTIGQVGTTVQSTNIQLGIAVGMGILATQKSADVSGFNQRIPNVLIFTDGEPTLSSTAPTWWNVSTSSGTHGPSTPGGTQYFGNGFKAALTASYLKNKITDTYNDAKYNSEMTMSPVATHVYTVGLGIPGLTTDGRDLAWATLDPSSQLGLNTNTMNKGFTSAWDAYSASATASVVVPVAAGTSYTVTHPTGADAVFDPMLFKSGIQYNDATYTPITTDDLIDVFKTIAHNIIDASPNFPLEVETSSPGSSGYVTFVDPLGSFMRVTDITRISLCPAARDVIDFNGEMVECQHVFFDDPVATNLGGGVTKYTFEGKVAASIVAGEMDLSNVIITVRRYQSLARGDEVTVQIPAALLPLRDSHIIVDKEGKPQEMIQYVAHPLHLYYKAAPKPGVLDALANPISLNVGGSQDGTALSAYIAENKTANGKVRFYTNYFEVDAQGIARGGTTASWRPSELNDYYRFSFNTPLYTDQALTKPLTKAQWDAMAPDDTVWYYIVEYVYTDRTQAQVEKLLPAQHTTKRLLEKGVAITKGPGVVQQGGFMVAQADLYDLARPGQLDHPKCLDLTWLNGNPVCQDPAGLPALGNLTGTANMVRDLTYESDVLFTTLGNNGYIASPIPGALTIRKSVREANGLSPDPKAVFSMVVDIRGADGQMLEGPFRYTIVDRNDTTEPAVVGQYTPGATLEMRGNHQTTIVGLPEGATYTVSEPAKLLPPGYTLTSITGDTGTVTQDGTASLAVVTNTYEPTSVTVSGSPIVTKVLEGREWAPTDSFQAIMCPENGDTSACEFSQFVAQGEGHVAPFSPRTFTAPGTYSFMIIEDDDTRIEGISYSDAIYRWTVVVTDNGLGKLTYTESLVQLRADDSTSINPPAKADEARFTNTYDAAAMTLTLTARKMVQDESMPGDTPRAPRAEYGFVFQYLGADLQDGEPAECDTPPVFPGADETNNFTVTTHNSGAQVMSGLLTFAGKHIGHTFYYRGWEQPGASSTVTYSTAVWYWRVDSYVEEGGAIVLDIAHCQAASTKASTCDPTNWDNFTRVPEDERVFLNYYDPDPAKVPLAVTKTIDGRPWAAGESFMFTLKANDTETAAAITAGEIVMPSSTAVATAKAGTTGAVSVDFEAITFSHQGSYQFVVSEDRPNSGPAGLTYDSLPVIYEVLVQDVNHDGRLSAVVSVRGNKPGDGAAHFVNRYRMTALHNGVDIIKTMTGRDLDFGEFAFTVKSLDQASCDKSLMMLLPPEGECTLTVLNGLESVDPTFTRVQGEFNFTQDDLGKIYSFVASEDDTGTPGIKYDDTVYFVTLEARYDEKTGYMYVVTTVRTGAVDGEVLEAFDSRVELQPTIGFTNAYAADAVSIEPKFDKLLIGREWVDDAFVFTWTALTDEAPMPENTSVTLATEEQGREFSFGKVTFTEPGVYQYSVGEVVPEVPVEGMLYDDIATVITVTVIDNGLGKLVASVTLDGNEQFVNRFAPAWLTLLSTVHNPPGADDPKDSSHTTLTADASHTTLVGNGTGSSDGGGVERATVPASDYALSASDLDGYDAGTYSCSAEDANGLAVDVTHIDGVVSVPPGLHVTCVIEYRPSQGSYPPNVPETPVPSIPEGPNPPAGARTGGQVAEGVVVLPIILSGLGAIMLTWRRRLAAEVD